MNNTECKIFNLMAQVIQESSFLLASNSQDFWEGDRKKLSQANPGTYLWIVSQAGTDFFRLGNFPSQRVLKKVVSDRACNYGRGGVSFFKVEINRLNNRIPKTWERPQGRLQRLTAEAALELIDESFAQKASA